MMDNIAYHDRLCRELHSLYAKKNEDYGNSFHDTYLEEGLAMARIRLSDKLSRFKRLSHKCEYEGCVEDESIRDTLIDLANYSLMTVMELDMTVEGKKLIERVVFNVRDDDPHFRLSDLGNGNEENGIFDPYEKPADACECKGGNYGATEKADNNDK